MSGPARITLRHRRWSLRLHRRALALNLGLLALLTAAGVAALLQGRIPVSPADLWQLLTGAAPGRAVAHAVFDIRLPRLLVTLGAGAALGASGAVFQSIARNPLGSPDVIGFTAGAASGALVQIIAFGGSGGRCRARDHGRGIADRGRGLSSGAQERPRRRASAGADRHRRRRDAERAQCAVAGQGRSGRRDLGQSVAGGLGRGRDWGHVWPLWTGLVLLLPAMLFGMRPLALMAMGDDLAGPLGVAVERVRGAMLLAALLLVALATSAAGPVAFVALAAPQLAQRLGRTVDQPLFGAALLGALLLTGADLLTRVLPLGAVLPVGQVTGVLGGLYLIRLLTRQGFAGQRG
ncbi:iron chelate uptake ABC transporter family permease subunit [Rhodobacter capsulatus]|uniref:iron chelate uptake ABC transporter family permease subunit n=1 Tax=Rhodobacter capsulatus TaxID=1061 RepID=UPI004038E4F7